MTYQELRLWHWQQANHQRHLARKFTLKGHRMAASDAEAKQAMHLSAVELLNTTEGCTATTVEQDAER